MRLIAQTPGSFSLQTCRRMAHVQHIRKGGRLLKTAWDHWFHQTRSAHVAIVGSGPAGYYTAQHILKAHSSVQVDIYEKLPVPFGLVRFGVAPDHPEVKNVINTFTQTAQSDRCRFLGNVNVGKDVSIKELRSAYSAVVLAYGADEDKTFDIPGENLEGVYSARSFVGWYNGLPENAELKTNLDTDTAIVLGMGNVALDVARVLLTPIDILRKTDITEYAVEELLKSRIKRVILAGRRGPLQVAFTTAELREMVRLPGCRPLLDKEDFDGLSDQIKEIPRPRKRLTELMIKTATEKPGEKDAVRWRDASKEWSLKFLRSPVEFMGHSGELSAIRLGINELEGPVGEKQRAVSTGDTEDIECGAAFRSIGYRSVPLEADMTFDSDTNTVPHKNGRVLNEPGLYCSGWIKRGPVGVIVSTMNDGFDTGKSVADDLNNGLLRTNISGGASVLELLEKKGISPVTFSDWSKIDQAEIKDGESLEKSRNKITSIDQMLKIARA